MQQEYKSNLTKNREELDSEGNICTQKTARLPSYISQMQREQHRKLDHIFPLRLVTIKN